MSKLLYCKKMMCEMIPHGGMDKCCLSEIEVMASYLYSYALTLFLPGTLLYSE